MPPDPPNRNDQIGLVVGAQISQTYLVRRQRSVAVNERDLKELLTIDAVQQGLMAVGTFMASGAIWLGAEKILEQEKFQFTPLLALCIASAVAGLTLFTAGFVLYIMRRNKIRDIFHEVEETTTTTTSVTL